MYQSIRVLIQTKYVKELIEARERLCKECVSWLSCSQAYWINKLPIESDGSDCEYYRDVRKETY